MGRGQVTRPASPLVIDVVGNSSASDVDKKAETVKESKFDSSSKQSVAVKSRKRKRDRDDILCTVTPWMNSLDVTKYKSSEQRLHHEILAFLKYVNPIPEEKAARQQVYELVCKVLNQRFQECQIYLCGSVAQELPDRVKDVGMAENVFVKRRSRIPRISFQTTPAFASLRIDIRFNNNNHRAVPVVKRYLDSMPALKPLTLVIRCFLRQRRLGSVGGLHSYVIFWMVVSMLHLNPFGRSWGITNVPMSTESLGILLADFFYYYGTLFPYDTSYISILQRSLKPKENSDSGLVLYCPLNPDSDINKSFNKSSNKLDRIKAAFRQGHTILKDSTQQCSDLGAILGLIQEMIAQREHVQHIVNNGNLSATIQASNALVQKPFDTPERYRKRRHPRENLKSPRRLVPHESSYSDCELNEEPVSKRQRL